MTTTGDDPGGNTTPSADDTQVTTQDTGGDEQVTTQATQDDAQFTTQATQDAGDDQAEDGDATTLSAKQVHLENNRPSTERPILSVNTCTCIRGHTVRLKKVFKLNNSKTKQSD